jgi:simple sugar transport system ATP-binding protein
VHHEAETPLGSRPLSSRRLFGRRPGLTAAPALATESDRRDAETSEVNREPERDSTFRGVSLRGITKSFNAVQALKGVDFRVTPGEVVGLVGDNGAGKSTLAKIMAGALKPDEGEIVIDGTSSNLSSVRDAHAQGIAMLFQDLALCDDLNVADNFFVGRELTRFGVVRHRSMHAQTRKSLETLDIRLPSTKVPVRLLSGGQRQSVAIARAVSFSPRVLILDEPTAALGVRQAKATLDVIDRLRANAIGVVLISHRMTDVLAICDRVTVLYEGKVAADLKSDGLTVEDIVRYIVTDPGRGREGESNSRGVSRSTDPHQ